MKGTRVRRTRAALFASAAFVLIGGPALVRTLAADPPEPTAATTVAVTLDAPAESLHELDRLIDVFAKRAPERGESLEYRTLGEHLLSRAHIRGDLADYMAAGDAFAAAIDVYPDDLTSQIGRARVALATHDFVSALDEAETVLDVEPRAADAMAIAGDAALAIGDRDAARYYVDMLSTAAGTDPAVMVRQAQLAFETGDLEASARISRDTVDVAVGLDLVGRRLAFFQTYAAHVAFETGDVETAGRYIAAAIASAPNEPGTLAELGKIEAARGDLVAATAAYERAIAIQPQPAFLAAAGDLYALQGDIATASDRYATVEAIATLAAVNQQAYNRAQAQYLADHALDAPRAVALAEAELEWRRDASGFDTYAWCLYRSGRYAEAADAIETALAIGPRRAPVLYHAGLISAAIGADSEARTLLQEALDLNPAFDPFQVPAALAALEGVS